MTDKLFIYCDGGSRGNPGPSAAAFIAVNTHTQTVHQQAKYLGIGTNNNAEYQAVLLALGWLHDFRPEALELVNFNLDSQLVVYQIIGKYQVKDQNLKSHLIEIKRVLAQLPVQVTFNYVPRAQNSRADHLVNETLDSHSV